MIKCPRCGSADHEMGQLYVVQTNWNIRFRADEASMLRRKKPVQALACSSCGHVELVLADRQKRHEP